MSLEVPPSILACNEEHLAKEFLARIWGKKPAFVLTIGNTETGKIPGLSAAGAVPAITDFTPAADIELLHYGRCYCIDGVPVTPNGIPTPGIITMSALALSKMPIFCVNGGVRVLPNTPYFDVGGMPGEDIRTGKAVKDPRKVFDRALHAGENMGRNSDYLVVGESIAGGTTTALAVLMAMGYDAENKVSSTLPENPHSLKIQVSKEGIAKSGFTAAEMKADAMKAVAAVGDPMMPAAAGFIAGAARHAPVIMAGGTQMAAVLAIVKNMEPKALPNIAIGTTKWITSDRSSDIRSLVNQSGKVPILAANLDFGKSKYPGLAIYETGLVKEGVGAGGISVATIAQSKGKLTSADLMAQIEVDYASITKPKN
jgi:uncharacterized protein (TIGR00303 family)